jgi:hypothetical protein
MEAAFMSSKGKCFVSMGFGKKTDFETGRTLDLDKSYRNIIKPAVVAAGLECTRADEIVHAGLIDVPMYERLLTADVVVVDLSASNKNAYYELGLRHAFRPNTTIVICEDAARSFPFDTSHVLVNQYHHMGEGIDYEEIERFRALLTAAITRALDQPVVDSPVYTFLRGLIPPSVGRSGPAPVATPVASDQPHDGGVSIAALLEESESAIASQNWDRAKTLLEQVRSIKGTTDPYVLQRLALATYRSRRPTQRQALEDARELLAGLAGTLNDPEVLSIWGAIHKRRWELFEDRSELNTAVSAYEKAFHLRGDYHDGITLAFLLNARASISDRLEGAADFVAAQRIRREVVTACTQILEDSLSKPRQIDEYSVRATLAEAWFGLGDDVRYATELQRANSIAPHPSLREITQDRIAQLAILLEFSPHVARL